MSDMEKRKLPESPVSYHTFIFPFLWSNSGKVTRDEFQKCIHPNWVPDARKDRSFDRSLYGQYVYFNQAARNVIFTEAGDDNPIVRNYRFDMGELNGDKDWLKQPKGKDNPVRYVIRKDDFEASLAVNGIRLRLFSTGVGMIVFELENYDPKHDNEKSINRINEYGRRVFLPFLDGEHKCSLCADSISLSYTGGSVESDIRGTLPKTNSDIRFMNLILYLLRNKDYSAVTSLCPGTKEFAIEPIVDDRMFVSCVWRNNDFALQMQRYSESDGDYCYLTDALSKAPTEESSAARRLYELVFVDGNGLSCRSRTMLRKMLEDHVYARWLEYSDEYATILGITEYSILTVSGDDISVNAHLLDYTEMAMLVLAQRASLLNFERRISDCARGKLRINRIQQDYVHFQSKYLLREVTPQQQGIELYSSLRDHLFIEDIAEDVENQISALFALDRDFSDRSDNTLLSILAILGIVDVADYLATAFCWNSLLVSGVAAAALIVWLLINRRNRIK